AGIGVYAASKAAMTCLDRALASELRRASVSVLDVRPPHTETGLADRPIHGTAPRLPQGLEPQVVADRIVRAIAAGDTELASDAFTSGD
ncbi:MAG: short-chain dehydrogenase, partial [Arsenicicoccus sp.]